MARPPSRLAHIISLRAAASDPSRTAAHQRPAGQPRALQPDRVADRRARRHDQRRHRLRQRVDAGVGGQLGRQPVGQRRVHQRVLGAQERAGDARLDVGLLVGDDRAARHLGPGPGRGRDAYQRHRRGLVGDAARGEPQVGAALSGHQPRRLGGVHRRSAAQRHHGVTAGAGQRLGRPARPPPPSARRRPSRTARRREAARCAAATPGTNWSSPLSMIRNGRSAPSSSSTAPSWEATPSPNLILTGRWLRNGAIIAGPFESRFDGVSDGNGARLATSA